MGIFDFFKKKEAPEKMYYQTFEVVTPEKEEVVAGKPMLSLEKRKETIKLCLTKRNVESIVAEVQFALDSSGSMSRLYGNGTVKNIFDRIAPIAFMFDDNKTMECSLFDTSTHEIDDVTSGNLEGYVENSNLYRYVGGGTNYAPVIEDAIKHAKSGKANFPMFVIVMTDGENWDTDETKDALREASKYDIYFQFVGIGNERFTFLKQLDNLSGRKFDNAGFIGIEDINKISDKELYDALLDEFVDINKNGTLKSAKIKLNLAK